MRAKIVPVAITTISQCLGEHLEHRKSFITHCSMEGWVSRGSGKASCSRCNLSWLLGRISLKGEVRKTKEANSKETNRLTRWIDSDLWN